MGILVDNKDWHGQGVCPEVILGSATLMLCFISSL